MLFLTLALVFLGTGGILVGLFVFLNRRRLAAEESARAQLLGRSPTGLVLGERPLSILRDEKVADVAVLERFLSGKGVTEWAKHELERAGSTRNPSEFLLGCLVAAVLGAFLGGRFVGGPLGVAVGTVLGALTPVGLVRRQYTQRVKKYEEQLPEALDMLVNALKAGYSLQAAMEFVGNELPAPLGPEFGRFYDEQRLGVEVRTALLRLQERVGTYDIKMFVTALLIQRETGGNLSEVLGNIAALMRERVAFRGQVDTLTAEPKASAKVLTGLPIGVFLIVYVMNPDYMRPLTETPTGHFLIAYAIASVVIGYFVLMKIAKIDI
ncbi:type II secretion system F family protein [Roseisolibacter sp. H3M3-2]|uniref:type II secretion system F family protein n=1 Tax=Roseisolibacter sp. H3M3-2 TaxID=3031323 RepID=UPI0023D9EC52|nr:type II secretion system F family protein [Roseisolibacter sp. H3M3-2]MDF1501869.1 type II secretion system F family protein [Roseisolibacter sp. H3M3-2]